MRPHTLTATRAATRRCALRRFAATTWGAIVAGRDPIAGAIGPWETRLTRQPPMDELDNRDDESSATPPLRTDVPDGARRSAVAPRLPGTLGAVAAGAVGATAIAPADAEAQGRAPYGALIDRLGQRAEWKDIDLRLLRRVTLGMTASDVTAVKALGFDRYLAEQLTPSSIDDTACDTRIATRATRSSPIRRRRSWPRSRSSGTRWWPRCSGRSSSGGRSRSGSCKSA
ncbi:MAG: hypothetical protein IPG88_24290 [Gemmatimonadetes bacterium]|nr:hypothetical protein [Gemmatimonadota bacterium]